MLEKPYPLRSLGNGTRFLFVSKGPKGAILKIVLFDEIEKDKWNLAFGDWSNGKVHDIAITNNNDITRVLGAVAQAVFEFSALYPERTIMIFPVDEKRSRLYNLVFKRRWLEIAEYFTVIGLIENERKPYDPNDYYDSFELIRKHTPDK